MIAGTFSLEKSPSFQVLRYVVHAIQLVHFAWIGWWNFVRFLFSISSWPRLLQYRRRKQQVSHWFIYCTAFQVDLIQMMALVVHKIPLQLNNEHWRAEYSNESEWFMEKAFWNFILWSTTVILWEEFHLKLSSRSHTNDWQNKSCPRLCEQVRPTRIYKVMINMNVW